MAFIIISLIVLLATIGFWHFFGILLGTAVIITTGIWVFAVASIIAFCIGILLLFVFTGLASFVIVLLGLVWTFVAILLFPILFPIILPIFILLAFLFWLRSRFARKVRKQQKILEDSVFPSEMNKKD